MTPQQIRDERRNIEADISHDASTYKRLLEHSKARLADLQSRCPHANTANVGDGGDDVECTDCGKVVVK